MTAPARFTGNFTQQEPIPEAAIEAAVAVLRSGRLHRYNTAPGETSETVLLETEFARYMGARYCLAVTSGGYALQTAIRAFGIEAGEPVLTNAFTLSPVPGAIAGAGGKPVLVEVTENLVIDIDDLGRKALASKARLLLLSHMRGHLCDMDALMRQAAACGLAVIEDCAHTMGAAWRGTRSGRHGLAACYSTQTYKHANSGEGGFIVSDDATLMARATVLSGSYMLYGSHTAGPPTEAFAEIRLETPNCSGRMDNLRAAILRPQLARLDDQCARWNARYRLIEEALRNVPGLSLPVRPPEETYVGSSIQFRLPEASEPAILDFLSRALERGIALKWFGAPSPVAYTSRHDSWRYIAPQSLPQTDRILSTLIDMRIPLTFTEEDCTTIGGIIRDCALATRGAMAQGQLRAVDPTTVGAT
jgi:dTDP-4-amino-4,6-dideoxygalactose transaminase